MQFHQRGLTGVFRHSSRHGSAFRRGGGRHGPDQLRLVTGQGPAFFAALNQLAQGPTASARHGGNDYITKPFLYMELATKALSFVIGGPVKSAHATKEPNGNGGEPAFSRRDLNSLKQAILGSYDG